MALTLGKVKKISGLINAAFNVLNINYKGNSNSTIGYEMLEGLQPGTNFTWQLNITTKNGQQYSTDLKL